MTEERMDDSMLDDSKMTDAGDVKMVDDAKMVDGSTTLTPEEEKIVEETIKNIDIRPAYFKSKLEDEQINFLKTMAAAKKIIYGNTDKQNHCKMFEKLCEGAACMNVQINADISRDKQGEVKQYLVQYMDSSKLTICSADALYELAMLKFGRLDEGRTITEACNLLQSATKKGSEKAKKKCEVIERDGSLARFLFLSFLSAQQDVRDDNRIRIYLEAQEFYLNFAIENGDSVAKLYKAIREKDYEIAKELMKQPELFLNDTCVLNQHTCPCLSEYNSKLLLKLGKIVADILNKNEELKKTYKRYISLLRTKFEEFTQQKKELDKQKKELNKQKKELYEQKKELDRQQSELYRQQSELNSKLEELGEKQATLDEELKKLYEQQGKLDKELKKLYEQRGEQLPFVIKLFDDVEKELKELEASPDYAYPKQTVTGSEAANAAICLDLVGDKEENKNASELMFSSEEQKTEDGVINQVANPDILGHYRKKPLGSAADQGTLGR